VEIDLGAGYAQAQQPFPTAVHPFDYQRPTTYAAALERLAQPGTLPMAGGTDLLVLVKEGLAEPNLVVDVRSLPGARELKVSADGARIGAAVRVAELATDERILARYPLLAEACASVGTTALQSMGTIGGNLCQRPRCWYFRRRISCYKNGGHACPAEHGENQHLAILGGGPCYAVHPSDPAVALTALDATVEVLGRRGPRRIPIGRFFPSPRERVEAETALDSGELVVAIELPAESAGGWQRYHKVMQRAAWDFALVSLAAQMRRDGSVRLVLGGVAPFPWRLAAEVERDVAAGMLGDDVATLADRALYDARPLTHNRYKVGLAAALLRRAARDIRRETDALS